MIIGITRSPTGLSNSSERKTLSIVKNWEPWVKRIVTMRNAVDHPTDAPGGRLITRDLALRSVTPVELEDPVWYLSDEPARHIVPDMQDIIEGVLELGEEVLVGLFLKLKSAFPLIICEIPVDQRDPACPKRLRMGLASHSSS